jgi:hypothetical protein
MTMSQQDAPDAAQLMEEFRARPALSVVTKLDILLQLARIDDPQIVPFLLAVVADADEPNEVRSNTLKWLSNGLRLDRHRLPVAAAIMQVLEADTSIEVRLQATLALASFIDVKGVLTVLGGLVLDSEEMIDVRYAALTSLERCGRAPECIALLRKLTADETFGDSARSLLSRWQLSE